jgi:hypothetical protein
MALLLTSRRGRCAQCLICLGLALCSGSVVQTLILWRAMTDRSSVGTEQRGWYVEGDGVVDAYRATDRMRERWAVTKIMRSSMLIEKVRTSATNRLVPQWVQRPDSTDYRWAITWAYGWPWRSVTAHALVVKVRAIEPGERGEMHGFVNLRGGSAECESMLLELPPEGLIATRPLMVGLIGNSLALGVPLVLSGFCLVWALQQARRARRRARFACERCGFPQSHSVLNCPECGSAWKEAADRNGEDTARSAMSPHATTTKSGT